jgi:hypothetical protein
MLCEYGCNQLSVATMKNGKHCCSARPSSCPEVKRKNSEAIKLARGIKGDSFWRNGHPKGNAGKHSLKGKTYQEIYGENAKTQQEIRSLANIGKSSYHSLTEQQKLDLAATARKNILERYEAGWTPKAGRCKKIQYESPIAGTVWLDGSWELAVAKWLDCNGYTWKRNTKRFPYTNPLDKLSYYTPDFYVDEMEGYLEVKGYETELDRCKWSQFPEKLTVWKRKELTERNIFDILNNKEGGQAGNAADC